MLVQMYRDFEFDSAHRLENYIGKCATTHGHRWKLRVVIEGGVNPATGMLIDFKDLKRVVNDSIIEALDHKLLNDVVPCNPTAENLSNVIYWGLVNAFKEYGLQTNNFIDLVEVQLWETPDCCITYGGK